MLSNGTIVEENLRKGGLCSKYTWCKQYNTKSCSVFKRIFHISAQGEVTLGLGQGVVAGQGHAQETEGQDLEVEGQEVGTGRRVGKIVAAGN